MELGAFRASTFEVGVDFVDIWRILFVVCDLKDKKHNQLIPVSVFMWEETTTVTKSVLYYK